MSAALTAEPQPDQVAAANREISFEAGTGRAEVEERRTRQRGDEPHPLSREAQDRSLNWFTIFFMGLFHAGAILAFFFFTWRALAVAAGLWFVSICLGIGVGYHRLLTH